MGRLTPLAAAFLLLTIGASAQEQRPVFRADVGMVPVYVTVNDGAGGFVLDLKQTDFEVRDNGQLQEINYFTTDAQPLSVLLLIDGSTSMTAVYDEVIEAATSFVVRMLPADRAAVASFADRFQMRQPFTSDRDALIKHLHDPFSIRMGLETRLYDALTESAMAFGKEQGRRIVLAITDGKNWVYPGPSTVPFATTRPGTPPSGIAASRGAVVEAMARDVMIYAVAMWTVYEGKTEAPDMSIARMAEMTGGGYVDLRPASDMNATFTSIMEELHRQYVLGFVPKTFDGKEHKLDVKVKRSGVKVRARRSYIAAKR